MAALHGSGGSGGHGGGGSASVAHGHLGGGYYHGHYHGYGVVYGGFGWWGYPYYYPYYAYPGYYYGAADYGPAPELANQTYSPTGVSYGELGKFWGRNVRDGKSSHEQFVAFLKSDVVTASETGRNLFQTGFSRSYGKNAGPVFAGAFDEARRSATPPASSSKAAEAGSPPVVTEKAP